MARLWAKIIVNHRIAHQLTGPCVFEDAESALTELCREFAGKLEEATGLKVTMWDERRTTVEAHQILSDHNYHGKKRKDTVDAVAASLILEGYLAFRRR